MSHIHGQVWIPRRPFCILDVLRIALSHQLRLSLNAPASTDRRLVYPPRILNFSDSPRPSSFNINKPYLSASFTLKHQYCRFYHVLDKSNHFHTIINLHRNPQQDSKMTATTCEKKQPTPPTSGKKKPPPVPIYLNGNVYYPPNDPYPKSCNPTRYYLIQTSQPLETTQRDLPGHAKSIELIAESTYLIRYPNLEATKNAKKELEKLNFIVWAGEYIPDWKVEGGFKLAGTKRGSFVIGKEKDKADPKKVERVKVVFHRGVEVCENLKMKVLLSAGLGHAAKDAAGEVKKGDYANWTLELKHERLECVAEIEEVRNVTYAYENVLYKSKL